MKIFIYLFIFLRTGFVTSRTEKHAPHVTFTRVSHGNWTRLGVQLTNDKKIKKKRTMCLSLLRLAYAADSESLRCSLRFCVRLRRSLGMKDRILF